MLNLKRNKKQNETIRFKPDLFIGLSRSNVEHRIKNKETNFVKNTTEKSYLQIIFNNVFSFFNILMFAIAFMLITFVGLEVILNLAFLLLAVINTAIGTFQECKSKKALKKLKLLSQNKVQVIREGRIEEIYSNEIVLDDILILMAGDQIPADCIMEEEKTMEINESLLTGESRAVRKTKGDRLYAGSFVISGTSRVHVDCVGENTYIHSIEAKTKLFKKPQSKLMLGINRIIKTLACIAVPLAGIVFINQLLNLGTDNYKDIIKNAGLIIPYMIPAGMLLLSSVSMMSGVVNLSKKNVLAQDLASVEALSRIDTICLDKTGTLTDGTMTVEKTILRGSGDIDAIISSYMGAFENQNQTGKAIIKKHGNDIIYKAKKVLEFSSARKYSAVEFENGDVYVLGAPEYILPNNDSLMELVENYSKHGSRVVVLAKIIWGKIEEDKVNIHRAKEFATFVIRDNIRPEVPDAMRWFRENDVDIKVISGDNIGTVSYIAQHSGIENWERAVDMSKITEKDNFEEIVMNNTVFARVSPEQKAAIVDVLKKNERIVGMTGDGINDLPALKKADCSIALSNGAGATKNIANLVLLDSNFANMKEAVFEGRRVVNNVQRSSTLFVMKDFLWMFITIWPILFGLNFDLEPTVMTLVNLFITGLGSLFLALEPDKRRIHGDFIKNVIGTGIISGFYMFLPVMFVYIYSFFYCQFNVSAISDFIKTDMFPVISICIAIAGFVIFYKICSPFTKYRSRLFKIILAIVVFLLFLIPDFFLMNGTELMEEIMEMYGRGFIDIISGFIHRLFKLGIYQDLALYQWIFIIGFFIFSTVIYKITDYFLSKYLNITMFNPDRFKD